MTTIFLPLGWVGVLSRNSSAIFQGTSRDGFLSPGMVYGEMIIEPCVCHEIDATNLSKEEVLIEVLEHLGVGQ